MSTSRRTLRDVRLKSLSPPTSPSGLPASPHLWSLDLPESMAEHDGLLGDQASRQHNSPQPPSRLVSPVGSRDPEDQKPDVRRSLSALNGLALVVSVQIGSGIFSSPSIVVNNAGSVGVAVVVWIIGGIVAWTGAASYIELGTAIPLNGGTQEYLRYCYNDYAGFIAGWSFIIVIKPCSSAILSLIVSEYLLRLFPLPEEALGWAIKGVALGMSALITFVNCIGTGAVAGTANISFIIKLMGLGSIIVTGIAISLAHITYNGQAYPTSVRPHDMWEFAGSFADAVLAALWAYSGWESLGFVAGELREPRRTLPRIIHSAMTVVIILYALCNYAYGAVLSLEELGKTNTVALDFGQRVFGRGGAIFYSIIVCLSGLGALNSKTFMSAKLVQQAAKRKYFPEFLANSAHSADQMPTGENHLKHSSAASAWGRGFWPFGKTGDVPLNAMLFNYFLVTFYVISGSFRVLLTFNVMAEYVLLFAAVAGVFVLRANPPSSGDAHDGPANMYHTGLWNPLIFCTVIAFVIMRSALRHPFQGSILVLFYLGTIPLYRSKWFQRFVGR